MKINEFFNKLLKLRKFKSLTEITSLLSKKYPTENFNTATIKILFNENKLKNYLFITGDNFWFIMDNGKKCKAYCTPKNKLKILPGEVDSYNYGKLILANIPYPILYNKSLTGTKKSFYNYLEANK